MTSGDSLSCKCPACKKVVQKPLGGREPRTHSEILEGETKCPHCQCSLHYWAKWTVTVELERESRVT